MVTDGLTYLCMSDQDFSRPAAFQFLTDIKDRFQATYGDRAKTAIAFAFNADFARVLQAQMDKFNTEGDPKIVKIRQQLGEVKDVMMVRAKCTLGRCSPVSGVHLTDGIVLLLFALLIQENIDRVLLRGEKIELLVDKTEVLEQHAFKFHRFDQLRQ
jgi:hypothetical protein